MLHHANLLIGPEAWAISKLSQEHSSETQDVRFLHYESLTIANARDLIKSAGLKSFGNASSVYVIVAGALLKEAQNALLKLLEDPHPGTVFYFIIPREDILLPTLRSRFHLLDIYTKDADGSVFSEFLAASHAERLLAIETKLKQEDTEWVSHLIEGFENYVHISKNEHLMKDILMLIRYSNINGSSKKMLLEHVSLSL